MKRRKPLRRSTTPIKARKADKSKRRFANLRDEAYQGWIRQQPCAISGRKWFDEYPAVCDGAVQCAHLKARGAGGADRDNCLPLCAKHHYQQHEMGIKSFQEAFGLDLAAVAAALDVQYQESR